MMTLMRTPLVSLVARGAYHRRRARLGDKMVTRLTYFFLASSMSFPIVESGLIDSMNKIWDAFNTMISGP